MTPEIKEIYTAVWQLHKAYFEPCTDMAWEELVSKSQGLIRKYNNQFVRDLVQAMVSEIENRNNNQL